ncbi:MAG: hypothetical protein GY861_20930 [bacterium]|nr:hypothetical protein [bacterium]
MKITITLDELLRRGSWVSFSQERGIDPMSWEELGRFREYELAEKEFVDLGIAMSLVIQHDEDYGLDG